jgi:hypothetical protein
MHVAGFQWYHTVLEASKAGACEGECASQRDPIRKDTPATRGRQRCLTYCLPIQHGCDALGYSLVLELHPPLLEVLAAILALQLTLPLEAWVLWLAVHAHHLAMLGQQLPYLQRLHVRRYSTDVHDAYNKARGVRPRSEPCLGQHARWAEEGRCAEAVAHTHLSSRSPA